MRSPGKDTSARSDLARPASQSLQDETNKNRQGDQVYSVPIDVLQTISKDFDHLETELEKSSGEYNASIETHGKRNEGWGSVRENKQIVNESKKTLRIKSIRTIKTNSSTSSTLLPELEEAPPPGTVARVEIKTDRARNKTIFTILPALGGLLKGSSIGEPHSFSVNTCNLAKATKLIKPLHLQKLPILRDILETSIKASVDFSTNKKSDTNDGCEKVASLDQAGTLLRNPYSSPEQDINSTRKTSLKASPERSQQNDIKCSKTSQNRNASPQFLKDSGYKHAKKAEEHEFLRELEKHGLFYDKISRIENSHESAKEAKGPKSSWLCPEEGCHKSFPKLSKLKIHIFSHRNVRPFKCQRPGCSWAFHTAFKLKRHENTAHADKEKKLKYECKLDKCVEKVKSFSSPYNLNQHLKRHARPFDFKCPARGCEAAFQTKMELNSHLKSSIHRSLILQNLESGSLESDERLIMLPEHICHNCGKRFFNSKDLLIHVNQFHADNDQVLSHSKIRKQKYRCTFERCEKVFDLPSRLAAHARTHTGERPYPCPWPSCCWSFRTASKLRRHERTHKNDRKYVCSICSKAYFRPEHLKSHTLSLHNPSGTPERFVCPLNKCGKKFSARSTLYVHMKRHAGEQRQMNSCSSLFRCVIESCEEKFYDRNELQRHVSVYHVQDLAESTAEVLPNDQVHEKPTLLNINQFSNVQADQETVTAAAELDFIALLSSVGDEDGVNTAVSRIENDKTCDSDSISEQQSTSENKSRLNIIGNTENKVAFQSNQSIHIEDKGNCESTAVETIISEDQIISEMIIETLTSEPQQLVKIDEGQNVTKETSFVNYDDKIQLETLSKFLPKDAKEEKNAPNASSIFITPFSNDVKQTGPQTELITVDASAITPIKAISQNNSSKTSFSIGEPLSEITTDILPSDRKEGIVIDQYSQVPAEEKIALHGNNHFSNLKLDLNVSENPVPFQYDIPSAIVSSNTKNRNTITTLKETRVPKRVSVLKSKQPNRLSRKLVVKQLNPDLNKVLTTPPAYIKMEHSNSSISERKLPSILRRSKPALSSSNSPKVYKDNENLVSKEHRKSLPIQNFAETVISKKRAPKKQKLLNSLQEH